MKTLDKSGRKKQESRSGGSRAIFTLSFSFVFIVILFKPLQAANPPSLRTIPIPSPTNLAEFVLDEVAAIKLGKSLYWDMQVGSDGIVACATCHYSAGSDARTRNQAFHMDGTFDLGLPNSELTMADFPLHKLVDPEDRGTGGIDPVDPEVLSSAVEAIGSQGVHQLKFLSLIPGQSEEKGEIIRDRKFVRNRLNVRQVTPRNAPTVHNAVYTFNNFRDGRGNHFFNGVNPFGIQDSSARVSVNQAGALVQTSILLDFASLASQAVGPPLSTSEMSYIGRTWPDIGRKMLGLTPLGKQKVHSGDSVLGPLANTRTGLGLTSTYAEMIKAAFNPRFWENVTQVVTFNPDSTIARFQDRPVGDLGPDQFTQMEANFSLFFGLAIQLYEATLVSDDTPFDRFVDGDPEALTLNQVIGLNIFTGKAGCAECHVGAEFTGAAVSFLTDPLEPGLIEVMPMFDGNLANYDIGFYNIGVTPTEEDIGRAGLDPFGNPLSHADQAQIAAGNQPGPLTFDVALVPQPGCIPAIILADPIFLCPPDLTTVTRTANRGAFKTAGLRNIELTGPYFHNGGMATLDEVVDFYIRGGNFAETNITDLAPLILAINGLKGPGKKDDRNALIDFLIALTDERVRWEQAPFDHPQLFIPNGHTNQRRWSPAHNKRRLMIDLMKEIPATGAAGRAAMGLGPLKPFLADGLEGAALDQFHFEK